MSDDLTTIWQAVAWVIYLVSAWIIYRYGMRQHLDDWFPNSRRLARLGILVVLFSPAVMHSGDAVNVAPSLLVLAAQIALKSPAGILRAVLPWLFFGGIALLIDAASLRRAELRGEH